MLAGFWLAGDAAYISIPGLLTTWSKSALSGENGEFADSFNFYHSSHGIHVEQAFGVFVRRWGLLWRPLQYHARIVLYILSAAIRLHNFCIDNDGICSFKRKPTLFENEPETEVFRAWWNSASSLRSATSDNQGSKRDL